MPTRAAFAAVRSALGPTVAAEFPGRPAASELGSPTGRTAGWARIPEDAPNHPWSSRDRRAGSAVCLGANGLVSGSLALNPVTQIICIDSSQPANFE